MDTLADYEAWKAKRQDDSVGAAQVVLGTLDTKPDEAAGDLKLANDYGKLTGKPVPPTPLVKEYRNVFQQKIDEARTRTILSSAPILTQWLRNPENAVVAADDLENLSWWDRLGRNVKEAAKAVPGGAVSAGGMAAEGAGQLLTPVDPGPRTALATAISKAQAMKPDEIAALREQIFHQGDINPQFAQSILSDVISGDMTPADAMEALGPMFSPALDVASKALQSGGQATQEFGQTILPAAPGMEDSFGRQVGSGLGSFLTILAVAMGTGGYGAGVFSGALGAGEAAANARQAGASEDDQTLAAALGVLPGLTDVIPVERLLSHSAKAGIAAFLRSIGMQAAVEGGQEAIQQVMQNAIAQNVYAPDKPLLDQVMQNFATGGFVGALVEAGKAAFEAALPGRFHAARTSAERAPETQQKIAEMSAQAGASALRNRSPDKFRQFVEAATQGGPNENVFIPADQFVQYFQSLGVDPYALVDELEGVTRDDLDAAVAGGGDLKIPTATYAAKIAGSEHDPFLMENMRFDPNEFTAREAAEFNEKAQEAMQAAFEEAERIRLEHEQLRSFEQEIYDTMVSRLRAAGRSTDVATTEALLYPAFYRTMAQRSGMTVEDFLAKYPLPKVEGALPQGMKFKDADALTRTLAEARAQRSAGLEKRGPSLLEFIDQYGGINDPGGELAAMDAETVKRGRGKKTLRLARRGVVAGVRDMFGGSGGRKHGVDDVAQAAIEAGYLRDDPIANEYRAAVAEGRQVPNIGNALWEAIRRGLAGEHDYATDAPVQEGADFDQIEQYLASLGLSLEDDDAAIRQAIEQDQAGRQYGQVLPEQARLIDMPVELPTDPLFAEAVANTPGAEITDDGLLIDLVRYQKEEQAGATSVRTGVFYLPVGSKDARHYKGNGAVRGAYGGRVEVKGQTLLKRPLFVKGSTGGKAPEAAYDAIKGKGAMKALEKDIHNAVFGQTALKRDGLYEEWLSEWLVEHGADGDLVWDILENSKQGNQLRYALQENVIAHAVRAAGYDSVIGYGKGRGERGAFISEVFDVREVDYPTPGQTAVLHPDFARRTLFQPAYHGTPHLFDKFSTDHIGTGEGAQAFGWGLYFAGKKEIAEYYRRNLSGYPDISIGGFPLKDVTEPTQSGDNDASYRKIASAIRDKIFAPEGMPEGAVETFLPYAVQRVARLLGDVMIHTSVTKDIDSGLQWVARDRRKVAEEITGNTAFLRAEKATAELAAQVADVLRSENMVEHTNPGRLFQVEIPDDSELLVWDEAISRQPPGVQEKLATIYEDADPASDDYDANEPFQTVYHRLVQKYGSDRAASEALRSAGIPGHRYLDGGSRNAQLWTMQTPDENTTGKWRVKQFGGANARTFDTEAEARAFMDEQNRGSYNYVIYDDSRVNVTSFEQEARGSITFPGGGVGNGDTVIRLFQSADLSTMLHESGHYFLTVLRDLATKGETSAVADFEAVKGWWRENAGEVAKDANRVAPRGDVLNQGPNAGAFKRWFGDSKVVDENGEPLVVYHGTAAEFEAFDINFSWGGAFGSGFYFGDRETASRYGSEDGNQRIIAAYMKIENPAGEAEVDDLQIREGRGEISEDDFKSELQSRGFDGIIAYGVYVAFDPTQIKSVNNRGTFDPNDPRILFQDQSGAPRGGERVVVTADDVIRALETGTSGDTIKDMLIDVGMQEQFARGFEQYLMEGKAPNADLRTAFEKFRAWLVSVYQRLTGLNVTINDDIRRVFDRMLATDDEIAHAQEQAGGDQPAMPDAESMGLTQEEYEKFLKLRSQAEDDAKARLLREIMEPVKREQEKWFKDERAKVREEVERQVNAYRYYRALEWMGNRRWLGDGQPEDMPDMRMSKDVLVQRYGEGVLKTLPRGKQTVYTVEGGVDPDDVAGWFGFDSGDELVQALEKAPPRKQAIEDETDRVMRERHGDPLNDGSVEAAALEAVHTDKRGQWIAAELKAISEVAGTKPALTAKEARASARQTISRMRVRDAMASGRFLAAERKAATEAASLGAMLAREGVWMNNARRRIASKARAVMREEGTADAVAAQIERANASTGNYNETVAKLLDAKRRQLLNHALYMESRIVSDEVEKAERYIARLNKASTRERIAGAGRREGATFDYLAAIDEILDRYDFRRLSGLAEQRRGSLNAFVAAMTAAGRENELAIPERVLTDAARKPYKTLPVEELRGVIDSLKNLEHIAGRWNKLIDAERERELDAAVDEVTTAFEQNVKKRPPGRVGSKSEAARHAVRQYLDLALNASTMLREIDGFADLGPAYRNIKSPIDDAMNRLISRKEKAAADLEALYDVYSKDERRRMAVREHMPELGYSLSKWERIAVALNTGNAGNYQRLTDNRVRGSLTDEQVRSVLATLDERDARFVQSVWDYLETFRDDIAARERRATGVEPDWVEPQPVEIAGRTLKGGYYPLKYDIRLSSLARDDDAALTAQAIQSGRFGKAQTRNGHLKERAQASGRAVELDMSVLHRHVNQVIYDLELSEPVANGWKILQNGRVRSAFIEAGKQADFDALEIWLQDVGNGELRSADLVGRTARALKSNFTAAKLAFNLVTVVTQVAGLSQTAVVVGKKDFARGLKASFRRGLSDEIAAKSPFMAQRQTTFNKDIYDFYSDPKTGPIASRWGDIKRDLIGPLSFWLMTKVQWHVADIPTWMAGYQQGLREFGNDEAKAVAHADAVVKRAQASGLFADRSAIERGSVSRNTRQNDVIRLFTALGSYMFAKFNVAYERSRRAQRTIEAEGLTVKAAQEALSWTLDMVFLFTLEAVVIGAIKGGLPGMGDDDDDKSWLGFLASETAYSVMGMLPFIRDGAGAYQGFSEGGTYGGIINDAVRGVKGATNILSAPFTEDGEVKPSDVKAIINATGLATGLPAAQINRAVDAGLRQADGEDVSPLEYLLGRTPK